MWSDKGKGERIMPCYPIFDYYSIGYNIVGLDWYKDNVVFVEDDQEDDNG